MSINTPRLKIPLILIGLIIPNATPTQYLQQFTPNCTYIDEKVDSFGNSVIRKGMYGNYSKNINPFEGSDSSVGSDSFSST
jgi:hypothetical protein